MVLESKQGGGCLNEVESSSRVDVERGLEPVGACHCDDPSAVS